MAQDVSSLPISPQPLLETVRGHVSCQCVLRRRRALIGGPRGNPRGKHVAAAAAAAAAAATSSARGVYFATLHLLVCHFTAD